MVEPVARAALAALEFISYKLRAFGKEKLNLPKTTHVDGTKKGRDPVIRVGPVDVCPVTQEQFHQVDATAARDFLKKGPGLQRMTITQLYHVIRVAAAPRPR